MSDSNPQDRLLEHNYDGIQEYDNPLPRWWVVLFWISIIFSGGYVFFFHFGPGLLAIDAYNKDMIAFYDLQAEQFLAMGEITESSLHDLMDDDAMMAGAEQLFQTKCSQCHGMLGEGNIGPNLTDDHWIHGGQLTDIFNTVSEGVPAKGMLAWKLQLRPAELLSVASYVGTLRGTTPPSGKSPEGDLQPYAFSPEPEAESDVDATATDSGAES